ncbi:predicted protein [Nematostella vectensis]|uniref:DNA oxidative demethylase ALKBH2 n=2 Tax=Nematostella vectensis TaxID=45351 RepID=A7S2D3_NEMVE|nr:predicted protein [Nematostella vectensis]|eukprot:XP_001634156.1 predicted protein [Nematostella vectensis]
MFTKPSQLKWQKIKSENLDLDYVQLFSNPEANKLFQEAEKVIKYDSVSKVFVFGKYHSVPRRQTSFGDEGLKYTFSGVTVTPQHWKEAPFLQDLRDYLVDITGQTFNFVLVNRYKDGNDHMGEHRDDEKELVRSSPIASLSFGQARDFVFRHKDCRGRTSTRNIDPVKLELQNGSLLLMNHPTNHYWYHSIPVRKKLVCPRINFTFRHMLVN